MDGERLVAPIGHGRRRAALTALGIFTICLAIYHLNGRPQPEVDCVGAPYTAWSLVRYGSLDLSRYPDLNSYRGSELRAAPGGWVSPRPPGTALAAVPFVAPLALWREQPPPMSVMMHLGKLVAASYAAGTVVVFFFLCRRLVPAAAWPATILIALGTSLWSVASQALWMHGPATFWVCCGMYLLAARPEGRPWKATILAGLFLGLAVLTRPTTALFAAASGCSLLIQRRWRDAAGLALGGIAPVGLLCFYNSWFFGAAVAGGYAHDPWNRATPLWIGVSGLLMAPSRGLLVYSPALLLAPFGLWALAHGGETLKGRRGMILAWSAAAALTVIFYGRWWDWTGGWCYGPRFLCETLPLDCLLFALGYDRIRRAWPRRAGAALVALSALVQLVGVFGHGAHADWCDRHPAVDYGRNFFAVHDTQIEAHARKVLQTLGVVRR